MSAIEKIWSDTKRIFGLPITFTKYSLSKDRLFIHKGLMTVTSEEILLYRVRDLSVRQTIGQRIFGVGTVLVQSSDKTSPTLAIENVKKPFEVKEIIHENVEEMKIARRMRVGEILEDNNDINDDDDINDDLD